MYKLRPILPILESIESSIRVDNSIYGRNQSTMGCIVFQDEDIEILYIGGDYHPPLITACGQGKEDEKGVLGGRKALEGKVGGRKSLSDEEFDLEAKQLTDEDDEIKLKPDPKGLFGAEPSQEEIDLMVGEILGNFDISVERERAISDSWKKPLKLGKKSLRKERAISDSWKKPLKLGKKGLQRERAISDSWKKILELGKSVQRSDSVSWEFKSLESESGNDEATDDDDDDDDEVDDEVIEKDSWKEWGNEFAYPESDDDEVIEEDSWEESGNEFCYPETDDDEVDDEEGDYYLN